MKTRANGFSLFSKTSVADLQDIENALGVTLNVELLTARGNQMGRALKSMFGEAWGQEKGVIRIGNTTVDVRVPHGTRD
jgi:hypothetical protein